VINLHYWPTPNGHKISLFLEESGLPYRIVPVNIGSGEQFTPEFLSISPNNRMPAIVDLEPADAGEPRRKSCRTPLIAMSGRRIVSMVFWIDG
jgi:GST-like protein